jgi:hypothetical protein
MAKRIKTGRRALDDDRKRAAGLVASYFRALSSPGSCYCINPEDEPEFQVFDYGADIETLLEALQSFAAHGTFALMSDGQPFFMRMAFSALRNSGMTYEKAIAALAEQHNTSESTITRMVRRTTVKT